MKRTRILTFAWIAGICVLYGIHLLHLRADFPNFSPWMDYSKYTDEGWYGSAAARHFLNGSWRVPGDFNPAAALPVWPLLEGMVFRFTGVSLAAARLLVLAVFAGNLLLTYALIRTQQKQPVALLGVTIAAASAFLYAFGRLAILEPLLVFWMLLSWLLALRLSRASSKGQRYVLLVAIGFLVCLQILTKTTAIFVIPATVYLILHAAQYRVKDFVKDAAIMAFAGLVPWGVYYFVVVRPRFLADYHYLFDANKWEQPTTLGGWIATFWYALHGALWIDTILCLLAVVLLALSFFWLRGLWRNPLIVASLLAAAGYIFFTGWHNNMQPRYYQIVAFPLIIVVCTGTAALLEKRRWMGVAALAVIVVSIGFNLRLIAHFMRHTDHGFVIAARRLTRYIDQHPNGNRLLLSISGANITLITHLPSICDDFGTYDLPYRIHAYQPGWYAAWNEIDPGTLEDLKTQYSLQRVARYHAFDDEDRNVLILYKLVPLPPEKRTYDAAVELAANAGK
ncbi:glycosyltransferase family 39 protein [Alloacidobacterium dinghuense]|uniref:Glycosyltransferase family 39 protein n=1 Tax=Alloacidobacterium dinghuense TaxID=2763107 RepID=A0A7G8BEW3_9BACT|nr:glycosyltransferase family 39 protein [Alloacidobacterium dinghuense]QNI31083.1 glycosyltransferase family 39 protein [Alloacidobacterium dinghuense]